MAAHAAGQFLHPVQAERLEHAEIEEQPDPEPQGQVNADDRQPFEGDVSPDGAAEPVERVLDGRARAGAAERVAG